MSEKPFNRQALKAMVHHVARRYGLEPEKVGAVKMHKILWHAEVQGLRTVGPITNETFIKHDYGPFSIHFDEAVKELQSEGSLYVVPSADDYEATRFVGKGSPDQAALTREQWRILERCMERVIEDHTATTISERSHGFVWEATEMFQPMSPVAEALQWNRKLPPELEKEIIEEANHLT